MTAPVLPHCLLFMSARPSKADKKAKSDVTSLKVERLIHTYTSVVRNLTRHSLQIYRLKPQLPLAIDEMDKLDLLGKSIGSKARSTSQIRSFHEGTIATWGTITGSLTL